MRFRLIKKKKMRKRKKKMKKTSIFIAEEKTNTSQRIMI